jgi:superoxide dismutase, Cu-Zn family
MRTLALALLIPLAVCTACSKTEETSSMPAPATTDAPVNETANTAAVTPPAPPADATATAAMPATGTPEPATVKLSLVSAANSSVKGDLTMTDEGSAVSIRGVITGLSPGKEHGFHVHEVGQCTLPDFASAGEHFNPTKDPHGGPKSKTRHLGDIPNVKADKEGHALVDVTVQGVTLVDKDGAPHEILGKALVVHAMEDDYKTQPSGNSGARVACGVIR